MPKYIVQFYSVSFWRTEDYTQTKNRL